MTGRAAAVRLALAGLALVCALAGCVTLGRREQGQAPAAATVASLTPGMPLHEVLGACGPPVETWLQPDGLILIWRERVYRYEKIGVNLGRVLDFVTIPAVASTILSKLKFTYSRGRLTEDRLVATFDHGDRLVAYGWRDRDGRKLP